MADSTSLRVRRTGKWKMPKASSAFRIASGGYRKASPERERPEPGKEEIFESSPLLPSTLELSSLGRAIDTLVGAGHEELDILSASPESDSLLTQLLSATAPLLPRDAAALLMAAVPNDGVTRAVERCSSVLSGVASPMSAHVVEALLELVAPCGYNPPRVALLMSLLAPIILGRDAVE